MSATRLHSLTAILLATLYGVVGLTGTSLHYLATDVMGVWTEARQVTAVGYYHVHGSSHHRHFHHHEHRLASIHVAAISKSPKNDHAQEGKLRAAHALPHLHECPLLTLVCKLKLSHAVCYTSPIVSDSIVAIAWDANYLPAIEKSAIFCPRGPPSYCIA
jgi:hypothetical protein